MLSAHPILTCAEARAWEARVLGDDPKRAWAAMQKAGAGVGAAILRDFTQWRPLPRDPKILVLAGPGHNGGDALLAAHEILKARPRGQVTVVLLEPIKSFKPLARRAWNELAKSTEIEIYSLKQLFAKAFAGIWREWDITIDGLYGMGFHPPLPDAARELIKAINNIPAALGFRAAVDLPSGIADKSSDLAVEVHFTYPTGIAKAPIFATANAKWVGRIRFIDVGLFNFEKGYDQIRAINEDILLPSVLTWLGRLRVSVCDKRDYGHLLVVSGSRNYPGAQMLNVLGALRAGAGLVTALTPASHAAAFAAARPEAMWRSCAEEADGGHGAATLAAARELWPRATALLAGSGLGRGPHAQAMLQELVAECPLPLVLDADALMPTTLAAMARRPKSAGAVILTPHAGEFERLGGKGGKVAEFSKQHGVVTVLKGPITRISNGEHTVCSTFGGPVLARGGTGDVLAGIIGALLGQSPNEPFLAAARGAAWHGLAADALARAKGETSVLTAELVNYLPEALRNEWGD